MSDILTCNKSFNIKAIAIQKYEQIAIKVLLEKILFHEEISTKSAKIMANNDKVIICPELKNAPKMIPRIIE